MLRDGKTDRSIAMSVAKCSKLKQPSPSLQSSDIAYPQILQEIADAHKFSVTFVDVMEPSASGEWLCDQLMLNFYIFLCICS